MGKKSVKKNYIYNVSYQILLLLTPLITTPYISRVLGADNIGKYSYANSISAYFTLFATLGITTYGQREISYIQQDRELRSTALWEIKFVQLATSSIAVLVYLFFVLFQKDRIFYLIFLFNILSVAIDITWFFQGLEEFGRIVLRNVIFKVISILYIFLFVQTRDSLLLYAAGLVVFPFLSNLSLWIYLPEYVNRPKIETLRPFRHICTMLTLFVPTIAIEVYTVLDKTMIGIITQNPFENGYYEQAIKVSKMALTLVTALGTVMLPRIGHHFQNGELDTVKALICRAYHFVWFLGTPLCLGLVAISDNFVPWFFGNGYDEVISLLRVLSFLILAIGINNVTGIQYFIPTKRQNLFTFTVMIGAIVNFCLNMFMINVWGAMGAAVASVAAETTIALAQLWIVRHEIPIKDVFECGRNYWIAGLAMFFVLRFENGFLKPVISNTCLMVVSGATIYSLVLCLMKDAFFWNGLKTILQCKE